MSKQIRVLQVCSGPFINRGVEMFLMNLYRNIDRSKVQFDFLTPCTFEEPNYRKEILSYGGKIYEFGLPNQTLKKCLPFYRKLKKFLQTNSYDVIHISTGDINILALGSLAAKKAGVPIRIVHSQNDGLPSWKHSLKKHCYSSLLKTSPTHYYACSPAAGAWTFPESIIKEGKLVVMNNAIDLEKFRFDPTKREEVRSELGVNDQFVVGHVGGFVPQKNHRFLISIFEEIVKINPSARLLLIGEGSLQPEIKQMVENKHLSERVIFYGTTNRVPELLLAMDCFVFPSVYEGFGIVVIEAQSSGLPTFVSSVLPKTVHVTNLIHYLPLANSAQQWAQEILSGSIDCDREHVTKALIGGGNDIRVVAKQLEKLYCGAGEEKKSETE